MDSIKIGNMQPSGQEDMKTWTGAPQRVDVVIKNSQYVPNDPICKYGKMAVTVVIEGKEKIFCGMLNKHGKIERWWGIPTPNELSKSLFDFIRENVL